MKTIEERAEAYVNRHNSLHFTRFLAYLTGATEQKQIDINNACEWMRKQEGWDALNDKPCPMFSEEDIEQFRKAMGGE